MNQWVLIAAGIIAILLLIKAVQIIRPYERGVVERFGRYHRTLSSGLNYIAPGMEIVQRVDMRERVLEVPPQNLITKDNVGVTVDGVIYFEVVDECKVLYNVVKFDFAAIKLAQTSLRDLVGSMVLDEVLVSRDRINSELRHIMEEVSETWGVNTTRVEIHRIDPPRDIVEAMSRQMKAERTKRARIFEAEGIKRSTILTAEGEKQAHVLRAEAVAHAIEIEARAEKYREIAVAEGEATAIRDVFGAIHEGGPSRDLLDFKYLGTLEKIAEGKATKVFLPLEATKVLGGFAGIGEVLKGFNEGEGKKELTTEGDEEGEDVEESSEGMKAKERKNSPLKEMKRVKMSRKVVKG